MILWVGLTRARPICRVTSGLYFIGKLVNISLKLHEAGWLGNSTSPGLAKLVGSASLVDPGKLFSCNRKQSVLNRPTDLLM